MEEIGEIEQMAKENVDIAGLVITNMVNQKINSKQIALQFVLEELDAARQGNEFANTFCKNSGFNSNEYIGALNKTRWDGDQSELEHIQLFLRSFLFQIKDIDLMVKLSTIIVDNIMNTWKLGKYKV
jgi:hypothetical protein